MESHQASDGPPPIPHETPASSQLWPPSLAFTLSDAIAERGRHMHRMRSAVLVTAGILYRRCSLVCPRCKNHSNNSTTNPTPSQAHRTSLLYRQHRRRRRRRRRRSPCSCSLRRVTVDPRTEIPARRRGSLRRRRLRKVRFLLRDRLISRSAMLRILLGSLFAVPESASDMRRLYVFLAFRIGTHLLNVSLAARPCQRCVKKGQGDECAEGKRKKAKYLMDDSEKGTSVRGLPSPIPASNPQGYIHANRAGIATLAGYSSTHRPVTVNRGAGSSGTLRSPRIGDIGIIPPLGKVDGGDGGEQVGDAGKTAGGTEGMGYFAQPVMEGVGANGGDPAGQGMGREMWQETDTMYDNLPFDPAYRKSLSLSFLKTSDHPSGSIRLGSSKPRIRHALLHVRRFGHRHDPNPSFKL